MCINTNHKTIFDIKNPDCKIKIFLILVNKVHYIQELYLVLKWLNYRIGRNIFESRCLLFVY